MKDKTDKKIERIITMILVISFVITLILMAIGGVRKGGEIFLIVLVLCTIAVGVLYFPVKWGYNGFKRICVPALKRIYVRNKFFFRLMVVLPTPIGVIFGITMSGAYTLNFGIIEIKNSIVQFVAGGIIAYISFFTTGLVLYLPIKWVRSGSKKSQFYLRLTAVLSIVGAIIGGFIASIDVSDITCFYDDLYGGDRRLTVAEHIDIYGVRSAIKRVKITPNMTTVFGAAISCASVWIIYLSIFWIYRGLDSDDTE